MANARTGERYKVVEPGNSGATINGTTGVNATAINAALDSNWIACESYNQAMLEFQYTQSAGTGIEFYIDYRDEDNNALGLTHEEDTGSGVRTLYDRKYTFALGSGGNFVVALPLMAYKFRVRDILATGTPDASDTCTLRVRLGEL